MKKILQISNRIPWPLKDGGAMGVYNYTRGYKKNGCDITFATLNTKKHYIHPEKLPAELSDVADFQSTYINTDIRPLRALCNLFTSRSYHIERFRSSSFRAMLKELLDRKQFDCIVFESVFVAEYRDVIPEKCNAVLVLREHNVEHRIWERLAENEPFFLKRWYLRTLAKRLRSFEVKACNRFDGVMTVTEEDADYLRGLHCQVPIHASPAIFEIPSENEIRNACADPDTLFHIGSMDWMPNIEGVSWFLRDVMPGIHRAFPSLKMHLAGRNMPDSLLKNNFPGVIIEGEVSSSRDFILSKNIMIVPLLSGSGIRVKIIEGMALGKTIIATTIGAEGIHCENRKNILIADTPAEFESQIRWCIDNPAAAREIGRNARLLAEESFGMEAVSANALHFFQTLRRKE